MSADDNDNESSPGSGGGGSDRRERQTPRARPGSVTSSASSSGLNEIVHTIDDDTSEQDRIELIEAPVPPRNSAASGEIRTSPTLRARARSSRLSRAGGGRFWDPLRLLAATATGCAMWISAPNMDVWWLAFAGWVPLLWAMHERPPRHAFFYGWIAGFVSVFVGFFWMSELLTRFAGFGPAAAAGVTALFALFLGLQWALSAWITSVLCQRSGRSTLLIFPMAWTAVELMMSTISIFPVHMALSWAWQPLWIQTAEIGGAMTVSFVMIAINAALWECIRGYMEDGKLDKVAVATFVGWMIGVPAYGWIRIKQVEAEMAESPSLRVGVVQGNFGIETYSTPGMKPLLLRELQRVTGALQQDGAEVVLWGETAYPYGRFSRQHETDLDVADRRRIQRGFNVPVIVGLVTRDATGENPYAWNTAWVLDEDGRWGDRYDKNYPLMFGEAAPPGVDPAWYLDKIPSASHLNRGDGPAAVEAAGYRFGPLICYEDILASFTREVANEGINALVNLTNDSWFGKTREQSEHLGLAVFRAVEHRKGLLRSVNAGISAYVDPIGRVVEQTQTTDSDTDGYQGAEGFAVDVPMMSAERRTVYGMTGNLFGWLCIAGLAGIWAWSRYRRPLDDDDEGSAQAA
ncbi:Apolipoprotein N-acyltransferase [Enhygromyxa salina]|uniref:Apolipoprotein N-acyltransferase n=1 Tax=Enhygromyxa salina TaxID=215803 RepID=A0A2S9YI11_9BACT|nr:apolipoprotein N-acyltransferase [Enhygromyxa salina]PRQ04701.1 Apolipoprotein N-acyltransferase [Enhygromyxa salina]